VEFLNGNFQKILNCNVIETILHLHFFTKKNNDMRFFKRLSNGWKLGLISLETLRDHPHLLLFPVLSSLAMLAVCLSFLGGMTLLWGFDFDAWAERTLGDTLGYIALFAFYLVNYFVVVFFNVALVYSARRIFQGEEVTLRDAINFSSSRLTAIVQWAVLAATVGVLLDMLQERLGSIGKIVVSIIGMVWSIATFFVVPVIAFEDLGPIDAVKRSGQIIKEKWGESLGANFGFGLFFILGYLAIIASAFVLGFLIHPVAGIIAGIVMALVLHTILAAAKTVFLAAIYQHLNDEPHGDFSGDTLDSIFIRK
jgi:Family of unknown function (DUF6159)